ncbi:MAG: tetratricopeptide repeat protein [Bernardetiaceae bacterium]|nr:tetratricopeptide repeat protein [Bernardetiaceae bacterium]
MIFKIVSTSIFSIFIFLITTQAHSQGDGLPYYVEAEHARLAADYGKAIPLYDRAIEKEPQNTKYQLNRCSCYTGATRFAEAIDCLEDILANNADDILIIEQLATLYSALGNRQKAIVYYENIAALDSTTDGKLAAYLNIVQNLFWEHRIPDSKTYIEAALEITPNQFDLLYLQGVTSNYIKDFSEALEPLKAVIAALDSKNPNPDLAKYYYEIGYTYYHLGEYKKADSFFDFAKDISPYDKLIEILSVDYQYDIALAYYNIYLYGKSEEILTQILFREPKHEKAKKLQEELDKLRNTDKTRISRLEQDMGVGFDDNTEARDKAQLYAKLAMYRYENSLFEKAIEAAEKSLEADPYNYTIVFIQSMAQFQLGNFEDAPYLLEVMSKAPKVPVPIKQRCYFALGVIYNEKGDYKEAYNAFRKSSYSQVFAHASTAAVQDLKKSL